MDQLENAGQRGSAPQGALGCPLVGRPVGHGIGKGDAEFDDIGSLTGEFVNQPKGGLQIRVAGRNIGNKPDFSAHAQGGKGVGDPRHSLPSPVLRDSSTYRATLSRSLSPRPDTLITTVSSGRRRGTRDAA